MPHATNRYTNMQRKTYEELASTWNTTNRDPVVGSFDAHNNWSDYKFLFNDISNLNDKRVLDFGCGPGRNLVKYADMFKQIDGVDISLKNLENAREWLRTNKRNPDNFVLYNCSGIDITNVPSELYDIVFSTICLQHICVHEIRYNYFKEFLRVLKPGGVFTAQMGYGTPSPYTVDYYENNYSATDTNRACDTQVKDPSQLKNDLESIGFTDFEYTIRPCGPGDCHPAWIFFHATKPL